MGEEKKVLLALKRAEIERRVAKDLAIRKQEEEKAALLEIEKKKSEDDEEGKVMNDDEKEKTAPTVRKEDDTTQIFEKAKEAIKAFENLNKAEKEREALVVNNTDKIIQKQTEIKQLEGTKVEELQNSATSFDDSKKENGVLLLPDDVQQIANESTKKEINKNSSANDHEILPVTNTDHSVSVNNSSDHHDLSTTQENDTTRLEKDRRYDNGTHHVDNTEIIPAKDLSKPEEEAKEKQECACVIS